MFSFLDAIIIRNAVLVKVPRSSSGLPSCHPGMVADLDDAAAARSAPVSARARVRAELRAEILLAAHGELVASGPTGLSLRAVARRLGMVPSALYRYFPSRDALLTALIVEAYRSVGEAAASADEAAAAGSPLDRWTAVTTAIRDWARAHPQQWALVYGSPVPGYRAPEDTVEAALGITRVLARIVAAAHPPGSPPPAGVPSAPPGMAAVVRPLADELLPGRSPEVAVVAVVAWTQVLGMVGLELFGHFVGATEDFGAVFAYAMRTVAAATGIG